MKPVDGGRLGAALSFAATAHGDQVRKGTHVPYVGHLLSVAGLVLGDGGDDDEGVAALLHDVVEDTDAEVGDVRARFGPRVAHIVEACSDSEGDPKPPWSERKQGYLDHLDTDDVDEAVLRVSAADKLDNVRSMVADHRRVGAELWSRFNAPPDRQLWYYTAVADIVVRRLGSPLTGELQVAVAELRMIATGA